jgi:hypothetical protein
MSEDTCIAKAISFTQIAPYQVQSNSWREATRITIEIAALKEVVQRQDREIILLQNNQEILFNLVARLKDMVGAKTTCPGKKQVTRLNRLEALLIARGNEPITFSEVGKYLELGTRNGKTNTRRQNMTLFGKVLSGIPDRFEVFDSQTQKGSKMVRLTNRYYNQPGGK